MIKPRGQVDFPDPDPDHIPGIYNYCDRWCERCPLADRCSIGAGRERDNAADANEAFWDRLTRPLDQTLALLDELYEELDLEEDLDQEAFDAWCDRREEMRDIAHGQPWVAGALDYSHQASDWLEEPQEMVGRCPIDLLEEPEASDESAELIECVEVINWYHTMLYPKLMRAEQQRLEGEADDDEVSLSDADGSAKVALICTDRSLAAWGTLLRRFPNREDELMPFLVHLQRLRRGTEARFPNARDFHRPGFDD